MILKRRGMTIIELVVAITLFTVVVTLAIGGFVAVSRMKTLMVDMKDTQQKARLIYETVYRFAKEADTVSVSPNQSQLVLDYYNDLGVRELRKFFELGSGSSTSFMYYSCEGANDFVADKSSCTREELLAGTKTSAYEITKISGNGYFDYNKSIPPTLSLSMVIKNTRSDNDPEIKLDNVIILENVK